MTSDIWFTVKELADLQIPGLPTTERAWLDRVKRESWQFREARGRGRGGVRREYTPPLDLVDLIKNRREALAADGGSNRTVATSTSSRYEVQRPSEEEGIKAFVKPSLNDLPPEMIVDAMMTLIALQIGGPPIDRERVGEVTLRLMDLLLTATGGDHAKLLRLIHNQDALKAALRLTLEAEKAADE